MEAVNPEPFGLLASQSHKTTNAKRFIVLKQLVDEKRVGCDDESFELDHQLLCEFFEINGFFYKCAEIEVPVADAAHVK